MAQKVLKTAPEAITINPQQVQSAWLDKLHVNRPFWAMASSGLGPGPFWASLDPALDLLWAIRVTIRVVAGVPLWSLMGLPRLLPGMGMLVEVLVEFAVEQPGQHHG